MDLPSFDRPIVTETGIKRTVVPALEKILGWQLPVLDHGFIRVIDYMGNDLAIEEAARLSYGAGTRPTSATQGLLNYLMGHQHTSPFEMCELKIHVKLPIFVMRQWVRHRMASLNEYSARYSVLSNEFYLPQLIDLQPQSSSNKQGRDGTMDLNLAVDSRMKIDAHSQMSYSLYELLISDEVDLARELARMSLPVNFYTEMYWKIDLHNLFHFLMLRADSHAQKEIRVYAELLELIVQGWVPMAFSAYLAYRKNAMRFSAYELEALRYAITSATAEELATENPAPWASKLSKREWAAFTKKIAQII